MTSIRLFCARMATLLLLTIGSAQVFAQNNLPYLGQDPPGLIAQRFPPDSLLAGSNKWWHGSPVFSPDGLEMFWTEYIHYTSTSENAVLFTTRVSNNSWLPVQHPTFADSVYFENSPVMSVTGDTLYFVSLRTTGTFFRVTRISGGWSDPVALQVPIPSGYFMGLQMAVTNHGDIYFELSAVGNNPIDLYVSRLVGGVYQQPEKLGNEINTDYNEWCPFVDPEERYLIFSSDRPGMIGQQYDLYISFKDSDGSWLQPVNMGYAINATGAYFPSVTLDRQYLFFNTVKPGDMGYNAYWISAAVIDSLRLTVGIHPGKNIDKEMVRPSNQPNPFSRFTEIVFELSSSASVQFEVYNVAGMVVHTSERECVVVGGKSMFTFDATGLKPGFYHYIIRTDTGSPMGGTMLVVPL